MSADNSPASGSCRTLTLDKGAEPRTRIRCNSPALCELSVIDTAGVIGLDSLVNPGRPIEGAAHRGHLTDDMVAGARTSRQVLSDPLHVTHGAAITAYNGRSAYHTILGEIRRVGMDPEHLEDPASWRCVSQARSDWLGHPYHYLPPPVPVHRALGRCQATLNVLRDIAAGRTNGSGDSS